MKPHLLLVRDDYDVHVGAGDGVDGLVVVGGREGIPSSSSEEIAQLSPPWMASKDSRMAGFSLNKMGFQK